MVIMQTYSSSPECKIIVHCEEQRLPSAGYVCRRLCLSRVWNTWIEHTLSGKAACTRGFRKPAWNACLEEAQDVGVSGHCPFWLLTSMLC